MKVLRDHAYNINVTSGNFDGVSAEDYKSAWLMKTGDQVLTGQNIIQSLDALELTFTGRTLQGVDFERLVKNTVKIDEVTVLHKVAFGRCKVIRVRLSGRRESIG